MSRAAPKQSHVGYIALSALFLAVASTGIHWFVFEDSVKITPSIYAYKAPPIPLSAPQNDAVVLAQEMPIQQEYTEELLLLPDLQVFPPTDLRITGDISKRKLHFSTTYYNSGSGPLELVADPAVTPHYEDTDRDVVQNVYYEHGTKEAVPSGTFFWHQSHQHYHFEDFVDYRLEVRETGEVAADGGRELTELGGQENILEKATFCVRDVSRVSGVENASEDATFRICSKWRQGVSVGWGDTYFHDYPDQFLDISGLPSGEYKLSFIVNPDERFEESSYDNNLSNVHIEYDAEEATVRILESFPQELPELEHVYPEQIF